LRRQALTPALPVLKEIKKGCCTVTGKQPGIELTASSGRRCSLSGGACDLDRMTCIQGISVFNGLTLKKSEFISGQRGLGFATCLRHQNVLGACCVLLVSKKAACRIPGIPAAARRPAQRARRKESRHPPGDFFLKKDPKTY